MVESFTGLSFQESLFGIPIALLYPFFFSKAIDVFTDRSKISDMCNGIPYSSNDNVQILGYDNASKNPEYIDCHDKKTVALNKLDTNKFIFLIVIGIFGIIIASMIQTKATKVGIGIGGIITIIYALLMYWSHINEKIKVVITGLGLVLLIYLSIKLYKTKSLVDLFQFDIKL